MAETRLKLDEYRVLVAYARGVDITQIIEETGLSQDTVAGILTRLVTMDRGRARNLVVDYERQRSAVAAAKGPAAPPSPVQSARPVPPRPAPVAAVPPANRDGIEQMLLAAERSGVGRLVNKAQVIRSRVDELRQALEATEAERRALAEVEVARRALDAANARLRQIRGGSVTAAVQPESAGVDPKAVREWAAANGVECGPIGRVPRPVVEQYLAAQKEVA